MSASLGADPKGRVSENRAHFSARCASRAANGPFRVNRGAKERRLEVPVPGILRLRLPLAPYAAPPRGQVLWNIPAHRFSPLCFVLKRLDPARHNRHKAKVWKPDIGRPPIRDSAIRSGGVMRAAGSFRSTDMAPQRNLAKRASAVRYAAPAGSTAVANQRVVLCYVVTSWPVR